MTGKELRKELNVLAIIAEKPMASIAEMLGMTPQGLNWHLREPLVSDEMLSKVKALSEKLTNGKGSSILNDSGVKDKSEATPLDLSSKHIMLVPLVNKYAQGGYLRGYGDAEYIAGLPVIPFVVDREGRGIYKAFEVSGDSMDVDARRSYKAGDIVLGREIAQIHWRDKLHIRKWSFVIVHKTEGILIKDIANHDVERGILTLHPLNTFYDDFDVDLRDVAQIYNVIKVIRDE